MTSCLIASFSFGTNINNPIIKLSSYGNAYIKNIYMLINTYNLWSNIFIICVQLIFSIALQIWIALSKIKSFDQNKWKPQLINRLSQISIALYLIPNKVVVYNYTPWWYAIITYSKGQSLIRFALFLTLKFNPIRILLIILVER